MLEAGGPAVPSDGLRVGLAGHHSSRRSIHQPQEWTAFSRPSVPCFARSLLTGAPRRSLENTWAALGCCELRLLPNSIGSSCPRTPRPRALSLLDLAPCSTEARVHTLVLPFGAPAGRDCPPTTRFDPVLSTDTPREAPHSFLHLRAASDPSGRPWCSFRDGMLLLARGEALLPPDPRTAAIPGARQRELDARSSSLLSRAACFVPPSVADTAGEGPRKRPSLLRSPPGLSSLLAAPSEAVTAKRPSRGGKGGGVA